jgi:glyoxylase I family protein
VPDLDAMIARLRGADIVVSDPEIFPNGQFSRVLDPESNPVDLWEPS